MNQQPLHVDGHTAAAALDAAAASSSSPEQSPVPALPHPSTVNEQLFAAQIRRSLDESTGHLPYSITHRLAQGREAAVARAAGRVDAPVFTPAAIVQGGGTAGAPAMSGLGWMALAGAGDQAGRRAVGDRRSQWRRRVLAMFPLLAVVGCLYGISVWTDRETAHEVADVDAAILTDDVPMDAYADRGFGVFIQNSRQP